jgi:hypothetical protein
MQQQQQQQVKIPPPPLNGGLYTGQPFMKGAPWANIPFIPDSDFMTNQALRLADPPADALYQYQGGLRPGNNYQKMPGVEVLSGLGITCNKAVSDPAQPSRFFKYYYF